MEHIEHTTHREHRADIEENKNQPLLLSDILRDFFSSHLSKSDQGFGAKLWEIWPQFATEEILKNSKPVSFQKSRLILWVAHSVDLQEMSFYIEDLKQAINNYFGKIWVKDIYFTVNQDILKKREESIKLLQQISSGKKSNELSRELSI